MSKVICLGILVADVIAKPVSVLPPKGQLIGVDKIELHTGGCAANTAIDLAKLGNSAGVIGLVGSDGLGDFILTRLKENNVTTTGVNRTPIVGTSTCMVLSAPDGERSFIYYGGTNSYFTEKDIDYSQIKECDILFIAGSLLMPAFDGEPTARVLAKGRALGKYTILDTAWDSSGRWLRSIAPCLPYLDLFIPSLEEARMLTGENQLPDIAAKFLAAGTKNVVIKCGSQGCYIKNAQEEYTLPAYATEVIDTNGAGDSFVAGFITGLLNGWNLEQCGKFANAVGAHCVASVGASTGIKSKQEILSFLKERSN